MHLAPSPCFTHHGVCLPGNRLLLDCRHMWGGRLRKFGFGLVLMMGVVWPVDGAPKPDVPKASPIPAFSPAKQPVVTGEFPVGLITITFKDTAIVGYISQVLKSINTINGISQEEYYKIYSNGIAWPKIVSMPDEEGIYQDPHFYGYYCKYDYWENPLGWKDKEEGEHRTATMNQNALRFANKSYRGQKPRFTCYNYVTTRPETPSTEVTAALNDFYKNRSTDPDRTRTPKPRKSKAKKNDQRGNAFDPWAYYAPACGWGDPMWPNSKMQINDFSGGAFAHELGHDLGAPDVYHVGRFNDGIGGAASLMAYGPTANAFSRFYHHGYIKEKNHPTIKSSGTYTLYPRHIDPKGDEAVGFLIPSNHPHYMYHVEYIHDENRTVGVGPNHEGMLISVVNLGRSSFLGSPDYFYVYRPNDPFFRGVGDVNHCLFGKLHHRTEFNMTTEPSSRLPNLLDGGVSFKNIEEHEGTMTFDVELNHHKVTGSAYAESMLPQIRLDEVDDVQATSFAMNCTIKFRGEPLKTAYGFCWSTSKNPTVRDQCFSLAHREWYRGHAINLTPNTRYYVRAYATNGLGVRYSDEEKIVTTLDPRKPTIPIGPLLTDAYSDNAYLFEKYSNESTETSETFVGYSPTCVLAKLIGYYRPAHFTIAGQKSNSKAAAFSFDQLSWNPSKDDFPMRLDEVDRYFTHLSDEGQQLKLHAPKPEKDFIRNLVKITGVKSKPVMTQLGLDNIKQVDAMIRADLIQSRPVLVMISYDSEEVSNPIRWALLDGISRSGQLHIDFPHNANFLMDGEWHKAKSGNCYLEELMLPLYKTYVVTSCYFSK